MSSLKIIKTSNAITKRLEEMVARGKDNRVFLLRYAYPMYQRAQMKRWMTEGASEGQKWPALNSEYASWKRLNYAGYPGNGEKMLIRTGKLVESVIGQRFDSDVVDKDSLGSRPEGHNVLVTEKELVVSTEVEYAKYVNAKRNYWKFGDYLKKDIKAQYGKWFVSGRS